MTEQSQSQYAVAKFGGKVYDAGGKPVTDVQMEVSWAVTDPFAIGLLFSDDQGDSTWHASVDLFVGAARKPNGNYHGEGDVLVRFTGQACWMVIRNDESVCMLQCPAPRMIPFLSRVQRLIALNQTQITELVNRELDALLEAA